MKVEKASDMLIPLRWLRLKVAFVSVRAIPQMREHPISILNAILKGATIRLDGAYDGERPHVIFHITDRRFNSPKCHLREGDLIPVEVLIARRDAAYAEKWISSLRAYMDAPGTEKNLSLSHVSGPEERGLSPLMMENPVLPESGELCLDFITPFPTGKKRGRDRTFLTSDDFIQGLARRLSKFLGADLPVPSAEGFSVLPYYWHYSQISHRSRSQPGVQYLNGCAGKLYLKGSFKGIIPYLLICSEIHAGTKLANSQGYYLLYPESPAFLARSFPSRQGLFQALRYVTEKYDGALASLSGGDASGFDEKTFIEKLVSEISSGSYEPAPSTAFMVKKKDGSERLIEQPTFRDLVVQRYLLKTVSETFDRMFEETSIGYRKGLSRKAAIEVVRTAAADGYEWVIEADIADFFPSVDWNLLSTRLDELLPAKDSGVKTLLLKCVSTGYVRNGELKLRAGGLPQGNMLSPLLANVYLDRFDEQMKARSARLVRYADDFIILARTHQEAEALLAACAEELADLKLALKEKKTSIRHLNEGFEFLGIAFSGGEAKFESEEEFSRRLKKPLYITEPYVMLALSDDALEVRKDGKAIYAVPIRRVSEIMVMERAVFSTALIKRCAELKIPFSVALATGYCIATVRPDSKKHYDINFRHTAKFVSLPDTAHLAFAKEFAAGKLRNYATLFRKKRAPSSIRLESALDSACDRVYAAGDVNAVRGIEGAAARKVYEAINGLSGEGFRILKRQREKPDRMNSLLNFGYYLLFSRINATIRAMGLNPYLGFLHSHADDYESLVCDIQELFRPHVDRLILRLIGLKSITAVHFSETHRGFYLTRDGAARFIDQFEGEMERRTGKNKLSVKEAIYAQVLSVRNWALDEGSFTFYEWKP